MKKEYKETEVLSVEQFAKTSTKEKIKMIRENENFWIVGSVPGVDRKIVKRLKIKTK